MRAVCFILAFSLFSCYKTSRDCKDYKTGQFRFDYTISGIKKTGIFKRTDSLNINFYENKIDSSFVRWINDCEFVLHKINPKSLSEKNPIHMKILTTTDSSYTFEYSKASFNEGEKKRKEKGVAFKIK